MTGQARCRYYIYYLYSMLEFPSEVSSRGVFNRMPSEYY